MAWRVVVRCGRCPVSHEEVIDALPFGDGLERLYAECPRCGRTPHMVTEMLGPARR